MASSSVQPQHGDDAVSVNVRPACPVLIAIPPWPTSVKLLDESGPIPLMVRIGCGVLVEPEQAHVSVRPAPSIASMRMV